jgi:hypothetical protein
MAAAFFLIDFSRGQPQIKVHEGCTTHWFAKSIKEEIRFARQWYPELQEDGWATGLHHI